MNHLTRLALACASGVALSACSSLGTGEYGYSSYALVRVRQVNVGDGSLTVTPPRPYNRHRAFLWSDVRDVEDWTLNGPYLDGISFVSGLKGGAYLIRQSKDPTRMARRVRSVGKGEADPLESNDTAVGRSKNRRVEFVIMNK